MLSVVVLAPDRERHTLKGVSAPVGWAVSELQPLVNLQGVLLSVELFGHRLNEDYERVESVYEHGEMLFRHVVAHCACGSVELLKSVRKVKGVFKLAI